MKLSCLLELVVQKSGFLASEMGVDLSVHINQKITGSIFGGEGFIMQRLSYRHLAGAAFARYKYAYIYVTEFFYHLQKTPQGRAGAYELV